MKVEGEYRFPGQPRQVWALLLDSDSLRACIPGVESLIETSPDHFDAVLRVGVAAIKGTYKGKVAMVDKQEPNSYTLEIEGSGGPGFVKGTAKISLLAEADETKVTVDADGEVGGMLAGVGQRMLPGVARMLMNQYFQCLRARIMALVV